MIAAILHVNGGELDPALLQRMLCAGLPFTPAAKGTWVKGAIGLADARLWLTDESSPVRLPTQDNRRELVLAWDGRIDNRAELLSSLGVSHEATASDEALVLNAYTKWGVKCVDHLLGDFAFVLWDGCARRLFAARDHMGVRPLHYAFDGETLVIASRISQVLAGSGLARRLNEPMIADYLSSNRNNHNETFFQGVWRVPAAHVLQHDQDARAPGVRRYWSIEALPPIRHRSDSDYDEHFLDIARTAIASRLRTPHRVGVMLSGGLDSSTIACIASESIDGAQTTDGKLATFTAIFDDLCDADERRYVEPLVQHRDFAPHYVPSDDLWTFRDRALPADSWDEPFELMYDGVFEGLLACAQKEKVRVLFTGHGGDMLFCGSQYYLHDVLLDLGWAALLRELKCWPGSRWPGLLRNFVVPPLLGAPPEHEVSFKVPDWVRPEFAASVAVERRMRAAYPPPRFDRPSQQFDFEAISYAAFATRFLWLQAVALRHGIDLRHPFFDVRLIDFCMRIPSWQKQRNGVCKVFIRSAMKNALPAIVAERRLSGTGGDFTMVLDRGLRERERHRWEACFGTSFRLAELGCVDPVLLRQAFARYIAGENDLRWELASIFRLEQWLRHQDCESI